MLQIEKPQFVSVGGPDPTPSMMLRDTIDGAIGFLRRRYLAIVVCLPLSLVLAALYLHITPRSFTASAVMMIDTRRGQFLPQSIFGDVLPDASWVDSQIAILKSENVAANVVKQLRLAEDPDFIRPDPRLLDRLLAPIWTRLGRGPAEPNSEAERFAQAVGAFRSRIDAKRLGVSFLIKIDFQSPNPEQAAKIANAMVDAYIVDQLNAKYQANRRASDWLQERLQTLREQTSTAERAVVEFRAKNNMVAVDGRLLNDKQLTDLTNQLGAAGARAGDVQARLDRIEAIIRGDQADITSDATVSEALNNGIIGGLRSRYLELVNREADWSVRYGKNHVAVVNLRNQMRDIRNSMLDELKRIAETYKSEYAIAKTLQQDLEKRLDTLLSRSQETNQAQIALFSLEASAQSYRKLYDNFLQRYMESIQQQSFPNSEARLISPASVSQSYPVASFIWVLAMMGGGVLGFGFAGLREIMDRGFRTGKQVQSVLEAECLALVPLLKHNRIRRLLSDRRSPGYKAGQRMINTGSKILRTVVDAPLSQYAEAIRSIKLSADLSGGGKSVIGVTSSLPGEGKSTAAMALAQIATQGGAQVILLDCDLRNPSLSRTLAPDAKVGFVDVVLGNLPLEDAVWHDPATNLAFLPTVANPFIPYSTEVLASDATKRLFEKLQSKYDYVIVDLSPLAPVVDVRATCRLIDAYILVIEWGRTRIDVVQRALANARGVQENIVGVVLNKVDMDVMSRYDGHGVKYYHNKYFVRDG
jgi:polysaccharide biosynthesis transport protein